MTTIITGNTKITVSRFEHGGIRTDHYENTEALMTDLLMNSGDKFPFHVRDTLLPAAIAAWELQIKQDHCDHDGKTHGKCKKCGVRFDE